MSAWYLYDQVPPRLRDVHNDAGHKLGRIEGLGSVAGRQSATVNASFRRSALHHRDHRQAGRKWLCVHRPDQITPLDLADLVRLNSVEKKRLIFARIVSARVGAR